MTSTTLAQFDGQNLTMSSREVADLTQSRHDKVKQSIERLVERGAITLPPLGEASFKDSLGKTQRTTEYRLNHRDTMVVVARINPQFMARVVDRWLELEAKQAPDALEFERMRTELLARQRKDFELRPTWVAIALLRGAGKDGAFIAQVLGMSPGQLERAVKNIRAAGLGHFLPITARPPVGRKAVAAHTAQMSLEV